MRTYLEASGSGLFKVEWVRVALDELDAPGRPRMRAFGAHYGEGVNDGRVVEEPACALLCRPCAVGGYYEVLGSEPEA